MLSLFLFACIQLQPPVKETLPPAFSAVSMEESDSYISLLNGMRKSAKANTHLGFDKIGRRVEKQVESIESLANTLKGEHIYWKVKVGAVYEGKSIVMLNTENIGFLKGVVCEDEWATKLRKGDVVYVNGCVTKVEFIGNLQFPESAKIKLTVEPYSIEQVAKSVPGRTPNKKR